MRTETKIVQIGEWLGDAPDDWDYEAFYQKHLSQNREGFERGVEVYKKVAQALKDGKEVFIERSGGFTHRALSCGLYDGWVFWVPRPCVSYVGPIAGQHKEEFYNLVRCRIENS